MQSYNVVMRDPTPNYTLAKGRSVLSINLMLVVLFAAVLHATWAAIIKAGSEKFLDTVMVATGAGLVVAFALLLGPLPARASWPYLSASVAIHCGYFSLVALAFRAGDLSYVYPIMRGTAPLITGLAAIVAVKEPLTFGGWLGIVLLSLGILTLAGDAWRLGKFRFPSTAFSLANALVIASYTLVDGIGIRLSGNALSYVSWLFFLNAFPLLTLALATRPQAFWAHLKKNWGTGLLGGLCTAGSYGLSLWAMTYAPIALVAALRETSVIFATIIAAIFLNERFGANRYVAAGMVTVGAAAMKVL